MAACVGRIINKNKTKKATTKQKKKRKTANNGDRQSLAQWNAIVNVQVHGAYAPVDPNSVQLGNATTVALIAHIIRCSG